MATARDNFAASFGDKRQSGSSVENDAKVAAALYAGQPIIEVMGARYEHMLEAVT